MLLPIWNVIRDYAWGSDGAISKLFGREPTGKPEAELWLGAHAGSPAKFVTPTDHTRDLREWIEKDPVDALGRSLARGFRSGDEAHLPFLLKVLAAKEPLSLQAHPTLDEAIRGFAREEREGIPRDAPNRNYKDPLHKPEMIVAVSETFDALCGFREIAETKQLVRVIADRASAAFAPFAGRVAELGGPDSLRDLVGWLLGEADAAPIIDAALAAVDAYDGDAWQPEIATMRELAATYPGDAGVLVALLVNRVTLRAGEALSLPAGNIHAYLHGLGIEIMAASDNVLRGGLTPKHVDVPELLKVLDFAPSPVPRLEPDEIAPGVVQYSPDVPDFRLDRVEPKKGERASIELPSPAIAICIRGELQVSVPSRAGLTMKPGDAVYVTVDEHSLAAEGDGVLFVAMTNEADAR